MQIYIFGNIMKQVKPRQKIVLSTKRFIEGAILWIFHVFLHVMCIL